MFVFNIAKSPIGWSVSCDGVRLGGIYGTKEAAFEAAAVAASFAIQNGDGIQINLPELSKPPEGEWPRRWNKLFE